MPLDTRFCDGYLTIKPRKSQKGKLSTPRAALNNVHHVQNIFHKAVEEGDNTQVKVLLRYADMNIHLGEPNRNGRTALQECCLKDDLEMIRLLLDHGASLEATDSYGWTALHYAAFFGSLDIVRFLVLNCADLMFKNNNGETAYDLAQNPDVKFYLHGMMMLGQDKDTSEDEEEGEGFFFEEDRISWKHESDNDSLGNSIDCKTFEETDTNDSRDTNDTGYEDESPPQSPFSMKNTLRPVSSRHSRFGLLRPDGHLDERKSPRYHKDDNEHFEHHTEYKMQKENDTEQTTYNKINGSFVRSEIEVDSVSRYGNQSHVREVARLRTDLEGNHCYEGERGATLLKTEGEKQLFEKEYISMQINTEKEFDFLNEQSYESENNISVIHCTTENLLDKAKEDFNERCVDCGITTAEIPVNKMFNDKFQTHQESAKKNVDKQIKEEENMISKRAMSKEKFEQNEITAKNQNTLKKTSGIPRFRKKTQTSQVNTLSKIPRGFSSKEDKMVQKPLKEKMASSMEPGRQRKEGERNKKGLEKLWERFRQMSVKRASNGKK